MPSNSNRWFLSAYRLWIQLSNLDDSLLQAIIRFFSEFLTTTVLVRANARKQDFSAQIICFRRWQNRSNTGTPECNFALGCCFMHCCYSCDSRWKFWTCRRLLLALTPPTERSLISLSPAQNCTPWRSILILLVMWSKSIWLFRCVRNEFDWFIACAEVQDTDVTCSAGPLLFAIWLQASRLFFIFAHAALISCFSGVIIYQLCTFVFKAKSAFRTSAELQWVLRSFCVASVLQFKGQEPLTTIETSDSVMAYRLINVLVIC